MNLATGQINFSRSTGTVSIYYNPCPDCEGNKYSTSNRTNYGSFVSGSMTTYMLVNNASDLTTMGNSAVDGFIAGNFALGKSFSASPDDGFNGFLGIGTTFTGLFDGNGGLGTNYTISSLNLTAPSNDGAGNSFGLFPFMTGTVRNLNLANVTITGGADIQFIGALAGDEFRDHQQRPCLERQRERLGLHRDRGRWPGWTK